MNNKGELAAVIARTVLICPGGAVVLGAVTFGRTFRTETADQNTEMAKLRLSPAAASGHSTTTLAARPLSAEAAIADIWLGAACAYQCMPLGDFPNGRHDDGIDAVAGAIHALGPQLPGNRAA